MNKNLTFKDISLVPANFTSISSRSDVDTSVKIGNTTLQVPIIASNMDSVYSPQLSAAVIKQGGIATVHRFCTIDQNVVLFKEGIYNNVKPWVSVGVGTAEIERAEALVHAGAETLVIDVANGAQEKVLNQFKALKMLFDVDIIVGNFDNSGQINTFVEKSGKIPTAWKIGVGGGSACKTRIVAGVGTPSVSCILDCAKTGYTLIQDGGMSTPGDLSKALALGVKGVFMGRLMAGTLESAAPISDASGLFKVYRGSASQSSYEVQNKTASFRAPEGESYTIPISGSVETLMNYFEGGLRSGMTYLNARNIDEFVQNCKYVVVSNNSAVEATAYGKE